MASECKVTLKRSDDQCFDVNEPVACQSQTIKNIIEDTGTDSPISLPNVSSNILPKVIEYCKYHTDAQKPADEKVVISKDEIKTWDQEFVNVDQATLFDLILVFSQKPPFNYI
jgi:S-phase kinase-associated protein 1